MFYLHCCHCHGHFLKPYSSAPTCGLLKYEIDKYEKNNNDDTHSGYKCKKNNNPKTNPEE